MLVATVLLLGALGCSAGNAYYCDERTACADARLRCDLARRACVARDDVTDAGGDGP
jgi:hypothetical protein